jgi:hypothetical protein
MAGELQIDEAVPWAVSFTVTNEPLQRTWHALADEGRVWLVDPVDDEATRAKAEALGEVAGVIQLLDRHTRSGPGLAEHYGVPLHALPAPGPVAGTPFEAFSLVAMPGWKEVGLWWSRHRALVVPEAVGTVPYFAVGRRVGVHPFLRALPPGKPLRRHEPDHLLPGHGPPLHEDAASAIREALGSSRRDIPKALARGIRSFLTDR